MTPINHSTLGLLTPERVIEAPRGFVRQTILLELPIPARLPLTVPGSSGALFLIVPSARAKAWSELAEETLIASATTQRADAPTSVNLATCFAEARGSLAPYLVLVEDGRIADACRLIVGIRQVIQRGETNQRQAIAEILLLDFQITASAIGRPSPTGCRIDLALRRLTSTAEFRAPMLERQLQQGNLLRNPDALPLDTSFDSEVERTALHDGTPIGGIDWWLGNGRT